MGFQRFCQFVGLVILLGMLIGGPAYCWTAVPVKDDPLVRMPGTQPFPENNANIEAPTRCTNCHGGFDQAVEPAFNWQGSMMAQSARDFLFYACMTASAQDSIWAVGTPNATDICERCHFPQGWAEGRSDPTNASAMTGSDFDGVHCDLCHSMFDPHFATTFSELREGIDPAYWDEASALSSQSALGTFLEDEWLASGINFFNQAPFFNANMPPSDYSENGSGQYFLDDVRGKRASFADASARHDMFYSRYHKSKYFCSSCHDVSNPVLANLGADPTLALPTEQNSAHSYFHVERTFSEFMLSAYGENGGSEGIGPFAPDVFTTSKPGNKIASCQDCHMRDGSGAGASQRDAVVRPDESNEHPNSGQPIHDMTGGNAWVSTVLASTVGGSPNYDAINDTLLNQGRAVLTLDLSQGLGIDPIALLAGADRAMQQLKLAAAIQDVTYDDATGALSFRIQNQTGHKLISGFPEGRRMFVNIKAYSGGGLIYEVNPYDTEAATLKGLQGYSYSGLQAPSAIDPTAEAYVDALVYESKPSSSLISEDKTFHFALADGRYKDNRIPPKGFDRDHAAERLSVPVWDGAEDVNYYSDTEYAGGYDDVSLVIAAGADYVEVALYYQTTSREYIEFLRDEINGAATTLPAEAYIIQTDPFFSGLKAWGDTIWQLWLHNKNVTTAAPFLMSLAHVGTVTAPPPSACEMPGYPTNLTATPEKGKKIKITWSSGTPEPVSGGYNIYYDQAGKMSYVASVATGTTNYLDTGLNRNTTYCYLVTAYEDCDGNGAFTPGTDQESEPSNIDCTSAK